MNLKLCISIMAMTTILSFSTKAEVDPSAYRGIIIREGDNAGFLPQFPRKNGVQYWLNQEGYSTFARVDHIYLTYQVWTKDGTAKAGKDYQALEEKDRHSVVWDNQPYAQDRGKWDFWLKVGGKGSRIHLRTYVNDSDRDAAYPNGSMKYFYVILAYPWLEMNGKWCKHKITIGGKIVGCDTWTTSSTANHPKNWTSIQDDHGTPKRIKYVVYIEQH